MSRSLGLVSSLSPTPNMARSFPEFTDSGSRAYRDIFSGGRDYVVGFVPVLQRFISLVLPVFLFVVCAVAGAQNTDTISGFVSDFDGKPIMDVLIIPDGPMNLWTSSQTDGSFVVNARREFLSFRAVGYKPRLLRLNASSQPLRVTLEKADDTVQDLPGCSSLPEKGNGWIGGGLRVRPPGAFEGPVFGEHDAHWFIRRGDDRLHIVDGALWHSGLPLARTLLATRDISTRAWVSRAADTLILDLSGQMDDGRYWRWVGSPVSFAVEYETRDRSTADYFDSVIRSLCGFDRPEPSR
jgi:hypothetical protein